MSNKVQFRHQTTGTKNKYIDRVYINVIDREIRDRMDKMTMNRPLHLNRSARLIWRDVTMYTREFPIHDNGFQKMSQSTLTFSSKKHNTIVLFYHHRCC